MIGAASAYKPEIPAIENQAYMDKINEFNVEWQNELIGKGINKNLLKK